MSILDRAREQARAAADHARTAAEQARSAAEARGEPEAGGVGPDDAQALDDGRPLDVAGLGDDPASEPLADPALTGDARLDVDARPGHSDAFSLAHLGLNRARAGLTGVVDRIDPALLADVVIKATSLQETANAALSAKGSPYRISDILITATIPPGITFTIGRSEQPGSGQADPTSAAS